MSEFLPIVRMTLGTTRNGGYMLKCFTDDKRTVNTFDYAPFDRAGFIEVGLMMTGDTIEWSSPVMVECIPDGQYLKVIGIAKRDNQQVLKPYTPDFEAAKRYAVAQCVTWRDNHAFVLDTETSGLRPDSMVVELALTALHPQYPVKHREYRTLVQYDGSLPSILSITPDDLKDAPSWADVRDAVDGLMCYRTIVGWNVAYDAGRVRYMDMLHGLAPCAVGGYMDAMEVASMFMGEWDAGYQQWQFLKLTDVFTRLMGKTPEEAGYSAHGAMDDAQMTRDIVNLIADYDFSDEALIEMHNDQIGVRTANAGFDHD